MTDAFDHIAISCSDGEILTDRLTCGQRYIWKIIRALDAVETLNIPLTTRINAPQTIDAVKAKVAAFVERHAALRTLFPLTDGQPRQVLMQAGSVPLVIREAPVDGVEAVVERLASELEQTPFNLSIDLPVRCGIVTTAGRAAAVVLVFSHMVADGWTENLLANDFSAAINEGNIRSGPIWSPFDQSDWEQRRDGRDILAEALGYWRTTLSRFPRAAFYRQMERASVPRWLSAELESPAMAKAARYLAKRHRVSTATVLMAGFAFILGRLTHVEAFCTAVLYNNRTTPQAEGAVGSYTQGSPVILDVADGHFARIIEDTHIALLDAYMNGMVWLPDAEALLDELGRRRGARYEIDSSFNISHDAISPTFIDGDGNSDIEEIAALTGSGRIVDEQARFFDLHSLSVKSYSPGRVFLMIDTQFLHPEWLQAILFALESLIVTAALSPDADPEASMSDLLLSRQRLGSHWQRVGPSWIDLDLVNRSLRELPGVTAASVLLNAKRDGLVAYYCGGDAEDRNRFGEQLSGLFVDRAGMIPRDFVKCAYPPAQPDAAEDSWRQLPKLASWSWDGQIRETGGLDRHIPGTGLLAETGA